MNELHKAIENRVRYGRTLIYSDQWQYAADLIEICAKHMESWTTRTDDALRIPDVLYETSDYLRGFVDPNEVSDE